jgi:alkylhydroperoxidase family enzyme
VTWLPGSAELALEAAARYRELSDGLWGMGVDPAVLGACAARIRALVRCEPDPTRPEALGAAGRAALRVAEQFVLDPHGLRDADFEALHAHFDDAGIAALVLAVAVFDARARFEVALEVA